MDFCFVACLTSLRGGLDPTYIPSSDRCFHVSHSEHLLTSTRPQGRLTSDSNTTLAKRCQPQFPVAISGPTEQEESLRAGTSFYRLARLAPRMSRFPRAKRLTRCRHFHVVSSSHDQTRQGYALNQETGQRCSHSWLGSTRARARSFHLHFRHVLLIHHEDRHHYCCRHVFPIAQCPLHQALQTATQADSVQNFELASSPGHALPP